MVSTAEAASTTTSAGSSRRTSRVTSGTGDSDAPGVSAARSRRPPKKNPDSARKTSTPPDTRPNQTWNTATSGDRDTAKAVEVVAVEPRRAGAHRGGVAADRVRQRRRPGRGEGHHGRRSIYLSRWAMHGRRRQRSCPDRLVAVPALTPGRDQRDRRRPHLAPVQHRSGADALRRSWRWAPGARG